MTRAYQDIIRQASGPLEPLPTSVDPKLRKLPRVKAVLFDVYGTMLISGSGDVGTTAANSREPAFGRAFRAANIEFRGPAEEGVEIFLSTIEWQHRRAREGGIEYPEVDIVQVWEHVFQESARRGWVDAPDDVDYGRLAIEFETQVNPVWPMPNLLACLEQLHRAPLRLGIISNAQFFTIDCFPALLQHEIPELGFDEELCVFSYEHGQAKPGEYLYRLAGQQLLKNQIAEHEVLYVGNDMLNDILPAQSLGFRTALFAGDARSLRLREDDQRVIAIEPDLVVTDLQQVADCVL